MVLRISGNDVVKPVDITRDACDDRISTAGLSETGDTDERPIVLLVFACVRTSAVTLCTAHTETYVTPGLEFYNNAVSETIKRSLPV